MFILREPASIRVSKTGNLVFPINIQSKVDIGCYIPLTDAERVKTDASNTMDRSPTLRGRPLTIVYKSNVIGTHSTVHTNNSQHCYNTTSISTSIRQHSIRLIKQTNKYLLHNTKTRSFSQQICSCNESISFTFLKQFCSKVRLQYVLWL